MESRPKDTIVPLILLGVGVLIFALAGFALAGPEGAVAMLSALGIGVVIQTALGIVALYITAGIMGIDFGPLVMAVLKLAAIFVFPAAISAIIPIAVIDWLVSFILYFSLLAWLFDLESMETLVCAVVMFVVRIVAGVFIVGALIATT